MFTNTWKKAESEDKLQTIFVVKWWRSKGVIEVEALVQDDGQARHPKGWASGDYGRKGKDWAETIEEAIALVRKAALSRVAGLRRQADEIERKWLNDDRPEPL